MYLEDAPVAGHLQATTRKLSREQLAYHRCCIVVNLILHVVGYTVKRSDLDAEHVATSELRTVTCREARADVKEPGVLLVAGRPMWRPGGMKIVQGPIALLEVVIDLIKNALEPILKIFGMRMPNGHTTVLPRNVQIHHEKVARRAEQNENMPYLMKTEHTGVRIGFPDGVDHGADRIGNTS